MPDIKPIKDKDPFAKDGTILVRKIVDELERSGWKTETRQPFLDPYEGTHRDIDIVASFNLEEFPSAKKMLRKKVTFEMRLFIECKYIVDNVGLHTRSARLEKAEKALMEIDAYGQICESRITEDIKKHRYLSSSQIVYGSTNDGEKGYGLYAAKQSAHGMLSGFQKSTADYSISYPVVIGDDSSKISLLEKGSEARQKYSDSLLFEYEYIHHNSHRPGILFIDMVTINNLSQFSADRIQELILVSKLGHMCEVYKNIRDHDEAEEIGRW